MKTNLVSSWTSASTNGSDLGNDDFLQLLLSGKRNWLLPHWLSEVTLMLKRRGEPWVGGRLLQAMLEQTGLLRPLSWEQSLVPMLSDEALQ